MGTGRISMLFCSKVAVSTCHEKLETSGNYYLLSSMESHGPS